MTVRFVKKVIIFLCIPLLLLAILTWMLQVANSRLFESYRLNGDIQTVFIGDSHIEMGIDDRLFPRSVNLAKSSDGYIYSYAKLKIILTTHPQIRRVLLGYSYHNLSSYFNTFIDGRDARYGFAEYFFVLPGAEKLLLMKRNRLVFYTTRQQ